MASRGCLHPADSFCYMCGQFIKTRAKKYSVEASRIMCDPYKAYFGVPVGDQDKSWAPHFTCEYCKKTLEGTTLGQETEGQDLNAHSSCNEVNCEMENSPNFKQEHVSLLLQTNTSSQRYQTSDDNVMQEIRPLISTSTLVAQFPCIQPHGVQNATGHETLPSPPYTRGNVHHGQGTTFLYVTSASTTDNCLHGAEAPKVGPETPPIDYVFLLVFVFLCCCWPIGLLAIRQSLKARDERSQGNITSAKKHELLALEYSMASITCAIFITFFSLLYILKLLTKN